MKYPEIKYTAGWDYVLKEQALIKTDIHPPHVIEHKDDFILFPDSYLLIYKGYPWDGATGALDTRNSMVASLVHDCFCEMMRLGNLDYNEYSPLVHELLKKIALDKGMWEFRAGAWEMVVTIARGGHPSHPDSHPVLTA